MTDRTDYNRRYHAANRDRLNARSRQYKIDHREQIGVQRRQYNIAHGGQPMSENRSCSSFLGVHVAERVLSHLFKDVFRALYGNPGYDFRCAKDFLVDVKSSCQRVSKAGTNWWMFSIKRNAIADYFLCIAFDNRDDLNPLHIWLIPGKVLSHLSGVGISETTLDKWSEYEKPVGTVIDCCNTMKEGIQWETG